jgi:hypothetical protein
MELFYPDVIEKETRKVWLTFEFDSARYLLFRDDNVAALDGAREIRPLNRDVAEIHRNTCAHQRVGLIADMEVQMRLGRIAGRTELPNDVAGFYLITDMNAYTARLQMRVKRVLILSVINHHVIACDPRQAFGESLSLVLL